MKHGNIRTGMTRGNILTNLTAQRKDSKQPRELINIILYFAVAIAVVNDILKVFLVKNVFEEVLL